MRCAAASSSTPRTSRCGWSWSSSASWRSARSSSRTSSSTPSTRSAGWYAGSDKSLAVSALTRLSELLRYALTASSRDWVTVGDELHFVRGYAMLQQLRYGDRLQLSITGDDDTIRSGDCPPLLLQPLVENAIRHDLESHAGASDIRMTFTRTGERLAVHVSNPIHPEAIANAGLGLGLRSTRERLALLYGREASFAAGAEVGALRRAPRHPAAGAMTLSVRALIVDDEALARANLRHALAAAPHWTVAAECGSVAEARRALESSPPDVVFLDVQMPVEDGLVLARALAAGDEPPIIVFVTAFESFAIDAFEVHALDYLLKPFDDERFAQALARAEALLQLRERASYAGALRDYLAEQPAEGAASAAPSYLTRLCIRSVGKIESVAVDDVRWIHGAGNYVELHLAGRMVLHRITLTQLERRLDPAVFMRVHRSTMVRRAECVVAVGHGRRDVLPQAAKRRSGGGERAVRRRGAGVARGIAPRRARPCG